MGSTCEAQRVALVHLTATAENYCKSQRTMMYELPVDELKNHKQKVWKVSRDLVDVAGLMKATLKKRKRPTSEFLEPYESVEVSSLGNVRQTPCVFCRKMRTQFPRHLSSMHLDEPEVVDWVNEKDQKKKRALLTCIRNRGILEYNKKYGDPEKDDTFVKKYRKEDGKTEDEKVPCSYCEVKYSPRYLTEHVRTNCPSKILADSIHATEVTPGRQNAHAARMQTVPLFESHEAKDMFCSMHSDNTTKTIYNDPVLRRYFEWLCTRYYSVGNYREIRSRSRDLANFFIFLKASTLEINTMADIFDVGKFQVVFLGVRRWAGMLEEICESQPRKKRRNMKDPSRAKRIGILLDEAGNRELMTSTERNDDANADSASKFLRVLAGNIWVLSKEAVDTLKERRLNKIPLLPLFQDIEQLNDYLDSRLRNWQYDESEASYRELAKNLLAKCLLFNRRRPKELSLVTVQNYERSEQNRTLPPNPDIFQSLGETDKVLLRHMHRIEFVGKCQNLAVALLTPVMLQAARQLYKLRPTYVKGDVAHLFAKPGRAEHPFDPAVCLKEAAVAAKVKHPQAFKATALRKHCATMTHALHFAQNLSEELAVFMGHQFHIHKSVYTLPLDTLQRSRVAHCLLKINNGEVDDVVGKTAEELPDLEFTLNPTPGTSSTRRSCS